MPRSAPQNGPKTPMPWLRLWHGFLDNPKIQDQTRVTEVLRARYVNLLLVALRAGNAGVLPSLEQVAFSMRFDLKTTQETLNELVKAGLVEKNENSYCIHDWEYWQCTQTASAVKQKRYRERRNALRNEPGNDSGNAPVTQGNVVTSLAGGCAGDALDGEGEGEKNKEIVAHADPQTLTAVPRVAAPERVTPPLPGPPPNGRHPAPKTQALLEAKRKAMRASKDKTVGDAAGEVLKNHSAESDPDVAQ